MKQADYAQFKNTFEGAHGQQTPSPFSRLLSGRIDYAKINDCLTHWRDHAGESKAKLELVRQWLHNEIDPEIIENSGEIPQSYLQGLRQLGCMRAKIPQAYGGLGLSQCEFSRLLELLGSRSEVLALVVSVQQLGVAQGLLSMEKLETPGDNQRAQQLREKYLRKLAQNATGAFCLTTPETGSDPSRLQTLAVAATDRSYFELSGNDALGGKLYTTLGTIADVYIMLALVVYPGENPTQVEPRQRITAFLVDRDTPGLAFKPLQFCGWRGLPNAAIKLDKVRVNAENMVGGIGDGLKIAFMNLGSGRINIAAISLGMMRQLARIARWWGKERVQGGKPIGEHQLNSDQLVGMNANIYAVESFYRFVSALADQPETDIRLEAAMLKLYSAHCLFEIADETLQLRGGRGYETYASQRSRGETAVAVERLFRSARMMKIGEGGSNILQLYVLRCLLDEVIQSAKNLSTAGRSRWRKVADAMKLIAALGKGYFFPGSAPGSAAPASLRKHCQFSVNTTRRLKRLLLIKVVGEYLHYYFQIGKNRFLGKSDRPRITPRQSLEQRQLLLGHCAQIAMYLSFMIVCCRRAAMANEMNEIALTDEFCLRTRETVIMHFHALAGLSRKREQVLIARNSEILRGDYAHSMEENIARLDLPNIK